MYDDGFEFDLADWDERADRTVFMCEFDAVVAMCVLGKCYILQQNWATVWVGRCDAQYVCWVAWKARVVDCMPCTLVLTPYRAQNKYC